MADERFYRPIQRLGRDDGKRLAYSDGLTRRFGARQRAALDDPEVRKLAEKYGDPDDLLREDWVPQIPGITAAGSYEDYAREPGKWIYSKSA